jgi:diacylglycerol O-acyltransferase
MANARMLHSDAFAWYMEDDPVLRSTVVAIVRLDGEPDWVRLRERIDWLSRRVPQLRMCVQVPWLRIGPPRWAVDENFDLDYHLRHARVPEGGDWDDVLEFARTASMDDFDRARPLWEFTLLTGMADGGSAFVTKLHHSLTDGIGGVQLAALVIDGGPNPTPVGELPDPPVGRRQSALALTTQAVRDDAAELLSGVGRVATSLPRHAWRLMRNPVAEVSDQINSAVSVGKFVAPTGRATSLSTRRDISRSLTTIDVPLDALRDAAHAVHCHVNDAYLAGLTQGIRLYHAKFDDELHNLRLTVPVSIRRKQDAIGGNRITLTRISLPADIDNVRDRMRHIAKIMQRWRHEPALSMTQEIALGLNLVPRAYLGGVFKRIEVVASDVPGIPQPVWLSGARVLGYYGFGPTIGAAFNSTLMSYAGTCNIGVNIDTAAVEDPGLLADCLRAGFDEVIAITAE